MSKIYLILIVAFGCHTATQPDLSNCMEDDSESEYARCNLKLKAGDYDGNGVIDWHDSYLYDHCENLCPECCVKVDPKVTQYAGFDAAIHCPPHECPGKLCLCIQGEGGVWYLNPEVGDQD